MKTEIISYRFDTRIPEEAAAYGELCAKLDESKKHCAWGGKGSYYFPWAIGGLTVELEEAHLFGNQWHTAPIPGVYKKGIRVFDWAEDYPIDFDKAIKRGHYLVITDEMREILRNTHKCGYCGAQEPAQKEYAFCPHCLGSSYLTEDNLHLTRMRPADATGDRARLTEAERAYLLPLYQDAQLRGQGARGIAAAKAAREKIEAKYTDAIHKAEAEYRGFTWLLDQGLQVDNVIYYSHTGRFCFGWRQGVSESAVSATLDAVSEFPFPYDIKCADGRTLSRD